MTLSITRSLVFLLILFPETVAAQQLRDTFRRIKSAVIVVHSNAPEDESGSIAGEVDESGLGSGVLVSADGKILTAAHVVGKEESITVEFATGERRRARVVSSSTAADLALLQVEGIPKSIAPARLGDSDALETGDEIFIVGAPYGLSNTLTVGRISARRPDDTRGGILSAAEFLQTDAVINPGNSGSPVFNREGEVIAIVSSVMSDNGEFQGVGFAATINAARLLLLDHDSKHSGIDGFLLTGIAAKALNLPQAAGFLITGIAKDSMAERMGLRGGQIEAVIDNERLLIGGDVILEINGIPITGDRRTHRITFGNIVDPKPNTMLHYRILRAGQIQDLSIRVPPMLSAER